MVDSRTKVKVLKKYDCIEICKEKINSNFMKDGKFK